MARRSNAMRMGSLNILVLVIAICLGVLGILSLVTAQASSNLSDRNVSANEDVYMEESAGQYFINFLDGRLATARATDFESEDLMSVIRASCDIIAQDAALAVATEDKMLQVQASVLNVDELLNVMGVPEGFGEERQNIFPEGSSLSSAAEALDFSAIDQYSGQISALAASIHSCAGGVEVYFTSATGINLHCVIGIRQDATYEIFMWETAKDWSEEDRTETLWMG